MTREQIIDEWIVETDDAIRALEVWRSRLHWWREHGDTQEGFDAAIQDLADAGLLLDWADRNPAGLDALAEVATWPQGDLGSNAPNQDADLLPKCEDGENCPPISRPKGFWIEEKMINGCGPYLYLRWRENGRCRSKYLGKVWG